MKIYTKTGDKGKTALFGGSRIPKHNVRIEAYGSVDELNSFVGQLRDNSKDEDLNKELLAIQNDLFTIGSELATLPGSKVKTPHISVSDIERLEVLIDKMEAELPALRAFIIPGGHPLVSICHIARTVCRRAERKIVLLIETEEVPDPIVSYMNRLSDTFFVMARKLAKDNGAEDIEWQQK